MKTIKSRDGTASAFDPSGKGPALIVVVGATATRSDAASVSASLAPHFSVFTYDRRGRGDSGDTASYAVEREIEDIDALIGEAGGSAFVFGHSSGAVLALEAARVLPGRISKLAVYEPPIIVDDSRPPLPNDYVSQLTELVSQGRRDEAVEYYLSKGLMMPPETIVQMRQHPVWTKMAAVARTIAYDGAIVAEVTRGKPLSRAHWASLTVPTLVMDGGKSPQFMHSGAIALTDVLPHAQHRFFPDQNHGVADEVLVPALVEFFKMERIPSR